MTNDQRPNSGLREGGVSHAEVNAALQAILHTAQELLESM